MGYHGCKSLGQGQQQPIRVQGIDWKHPLAAGLHRAWLFNQGGLTASNSAQEGPIRDWVNRDSLTALRAFAVGGVTDVGYRYGRYGLEFLSGASGPGSNHGLLATKTSGFGANSVSILARFKIGATNGSLESTGIGGGGVLYTCRQVSANVSPTLFYSTNGLFCVDSSTVLVGAKTTSSLATETYYDLCGTYLRDPGVATFGGIWKTYLNGLRDGTDNNHNTTGTFNGTFSDTTTKLGDSAIWDATSTMSFVFLYVWKDRVLQADDVRQLYTNPYAFFEAPAIRRTFFYGVTSTAAVDESFVSVG